MSTTVTVTDPEKKGDGMNTYVSYMVNSNSTQQNFTSGDLTVVRRYSDFTWLATQLTRDFPGIILPALPEKQAFGRFSINFVEARRRALEKFLQRIAAHPEIGSADAFRNFLQADDSSLAVAKQESKSSKKAAPKSPMSWFEGTVNTITTGKPELEKTAADVKIEEISQYINSLEKQLALVSKNSEAMVAKSREMAHCFFMFGIGFIDLGNGEGDALGSAILEMSTEVDNLSKITVDYVEEEVIKLVEPIAEYTRYLSSIKHAMTQRQEKKNAYINCIMDLESKQNSYQKLLATPGKEAQAQAKEAQVSSSQFATDNAKLDFEKVSERLLLEFEVFKSQKSNDLRDIIADFINIQINYHKQCEKLWSGLLPKISSIVISMPEYRPELSMYRETVASTLLGRNVSVGEPSAPIFDKMSNDYDNDDKHNSTDFNAKSASNFQEHDEGDEEEDLEGV